MAKPKLVGGLGIRYYGLMEEAAVMKDATNLWANKGLVLGSVDEQSTYKR